MTPNEVLMLHGSEFWDAFRAEDLSPEFLIKHKSRLRQEFLNHGNGPLRKFKHTQELRIEVWMRNFYSHHLVGVGPERACKKCGAMDYVWTKLCEEIIMHKALG